MSFERSSSRETGEGRLDPQLVAAARRRLQAGGADGAAICALLDNLATVEAWPARAVLMAVADSDPRESAALMYLLLNPNLESESKPAATELAGPPADPGASSLKGSSLAAFIHSLASTDPDGVERLIQTVGRFTAGDSGDMSHALQAALRVKSNLKGQADLESLGLMVDLLEEQVEARRKPENAGQMDASLARIREMRSQLSEFTRQFIHGDERLGEGGARLAGRLQELYRELGPILPEGNKRRLFVAPGKILRIAEQRRVRHAELVGPNDIQGQVGQIEAAIVRLQDNIARVRARSSTLSQQARDMIDWLQDRVQKLTTGKNELMALYRNLQQELDQINQVRKDLHDVKAQAERAHQAREVVAAFMNRYGLEAHGDMEADISQLYQMLTTRNLRLAQGIVADLARDQSALEADYAYLEQLAWESDQTLTDEEQRQRWLASGARRPEDLPPEQRRNYEKMLRSYGLKPTGDLRQDLEALRVAIDWRSQDLTRRAADTRSRINRKAADVINDPRSTEQEKENARRLRTGSQQLMDRIRVNFITIGLSIGHSLEELNDLLEDIMDAGYGIQERGNAGLPSVEAPLPADVPAPGAPPSTDELAHEAVLGYLDRGEPAEQAVADKHREVERDVAVAQERHVQARERQLVQQQKLQAEKAAQSEDQRKQVLEQVSAEADDRRKEAAGLRPKELVKMVHDQVVGALDEVQEAIREDRHHPT